MSEKVHFEMRTKKSLMSFRCVIPKSGILSGILTLQSWFDRMRFISVSQNNVFLGYLQLYATSQKWLILNNQPTLREKLTD